MDKFKGTGVALVTPFHENGTVDFDGLAKVLEFTGKAVDYFVVLGTTGESATTSQQEKAQILQFVKDNNPKGLPIVFGIGGNNTAQIADDIANADLSGVDAILSVSPYYNKPSQAGIIAHFTHLADASPVPIILYNVPGRTMSNMSSETTIALSNHPNIIGIKEATGDLQQGQQIMDGKHSDFFVTSGEDLFTTELLEIGGIGAISVLANGFPEEFCQISNAGLAGDFDKSRTITNAFKEINPLMYIESNPVGVKEVLNQKNVCSGYVRLPLLEATPDLKEKIRELIDIKA